MAKKKDSGQTDNLYSLQSIVGLNAANFFQAAGRIERTHSFQDVVSPAGHGASCLGCGPALRFMGRKPVMAVACWVLPFRILSYTLAHNPHMVVFLQALDGIGAGIHIVAIIAFAADLTPDKGQFNSLPGPFATAQGMAGVVGPILSGLVLQHYGFNITFVGFAAIALLAAAAFQLCLPDTKFIEKPVKPWWPTHRPH